MVDHPHRTKPKKRKHPKRPRKHRFKGILKNPLLRMAVRRAIYS